MGVPALTWSLEMTSLKAFGHVAALPLRQAMFQAMSQGYSKLGILIRLFIRRRQPYGLRVHLIDTAMYI
jgi:hypothetical protein